MSNTSLSLTACCPVCKRKEHLLRCKACKVVLYCSRIHQAMDRVSHRGSCHWIKKAQLDLEREERKLRALPGDWMTPPGATIFEEYAGRFWGILETRPYMRARFALVEALLKIKSPRAVQSSFEHIMDLLRLCRSDNLGVRDLAPALFIRLGKDQESYDFIKWWVTTGQEGNYDWGDMENPYLDVKDADILEPPSFFASKYGNIAYTAAVTLIKIRLLIDIRSLQSSTIIAGKIPQEILDNIQDHLVSTATKNKKEIMGSKDHGPLIEKLEGQIDELYKAVNQQNKFFWSGLLDPERHLTARPDMYSPGSMQEMQLKLQYSYDSWAETPGAIDIIKELSKKH